MVARARALTNPSQLYALEIEAEAEGTQHDEDDAHHHDSLWFRRETRRSRVRNSIEQLWLGYTCFTRFVRRGPR